MKQIKGYKVLWKWLTLIFTLLNSTFFLSFPEVLLVEPDSNQLAKVFPPASSSVTRTLLPVFSQYHCWAKVFPHITYRLAVSAYCGSKDALPYDGVRVTGGKTVKRMTWRKRESLRVSGIFELSRLRVTKRKLPKYVELIDPIVRVAGSQRS